MTTFKSLGLREDVVNSLKNLVLGYLLKFLRLILSSVK